MPPAKKKAKLVEIPESRNPAKDQMAAQNFDPLLESIKIAQGKALTEDHPFLKTLEKWVMKLSDKVELNHYKIERDDLEDLLGLAETALTDSWVPHRLRSDHIRDLLQYIYPKLKSTEHTGQIQHDMKVAPLTAAEMKRFNKTFGDSY